MGFLDDLEDDDKVILENVLITIRDKCPTALDAITYLETKTGEKSTQSLSNLRDVIFHLATLIGVINDPAKTKSKDQQLGTIEEHFRRAIIEPYEHAANIRLAKLKELYEDYLKIVCPISTKLNPLPIDNNEVKGRLEAAEELIRKGRDAKKENDWTSKWEDGCKAFETAFKEADTLNDILSVQIARADSHRKSKRYLLIGIGAAILIALVFFFVGKFF
jgi:hypothetical protein